MYQQYQYVIINKYNNNINYTFPQSSAMHISITTTTNHIQINKYTPIVTCMSYPTNTIITLMIHIYSTITYIEKCTCVVSACIEPCVVGFQHICHHKRHLCFHLNNSFLHFLFLGKPHIFTLFILKL